MKTILLVLLGLLAAAAGIFVGVKYPQQITNKVNNTKGIHLLRVQHLAAHRENRSC